MMGWTRRAATGGTRRSLWRASCLAALVGLALPPTVVVSQVSAAGVAVDTTVDENGDNLAGCSLRESLVALSSGVAFGGCDVPGGATVTFDAALAGQTITVGSPLVVDQDVTIDGADAPNLIVSGNDTTRVFFVDSGVVAIKNLTIADGLASGGDGGNATRFNRNDWGGGTGGGAGGLGGGILVNDADLTLENIILDNNAAVGGRGGAFVASLGGGGGGGGLSGANGANGGPGGCSGAGGSGGAGLPGTGGTGQDGLQGGGPGGVGGIAGTGFGGGGGGGGGDNCRGHTGARGGFGGFGAGGGGGGRGSQGSNGGAGGYGGGGGGQGSDNMAHFGSGNNFSGGSSAAFGGNGTTDIDGGHGGGGAGLGGALFVRAGSLTLDGVSFTGNSATAGMGVVGNDGQAKGGALFIAPDASANVAGPVSFSGSAAADAAGTSDDNLDVFGALPAPFIAIAATGTTSEPSGSDTFTFSRGDTSGAITAAFIVGGTATFGADYSVTGATTFGATSGTIDLGVGVSTATVTVDVINDQLRDPDETVVLTLQGGASYLVGSQSAATSTITDDDTVTVTVSSDPSEAGPTDGTFTFTRQDTTGEVTAEFAIGGGATFATDYAVSGETSYSSTSGSITFADGASTVVLTITPIDDSISDALETITLTLTDTAELGAVPPDSASQTIGENDPLVVSTTTDESDGDYTPGDLSLREAVEVAATLGLPIEFAGSLANTTISLDPGLGQIIIAADTSIDGAGAANVVVSGADETRVFRIDSGDVAIKNLQIANGLAQGGNGPNGSANGGGGGGSGLGGGVFVNDGTVTFEGVTFEDNTAVGGKGAVSNGNQCQVNVGGSGSATPGNYGGGGAGGRCGNDGDGGGFGGGGGGAGADSGGRSGGAGGAGLGGRGGDSSSSTRGGGGGGAGLGGAVFVRGGTVDIVDTSFTNNESVGGTSASNGAAGQAKGGAVFVAGGSVTSTNVSLSGSVAPDASGTTTDNLDWYGAGGPFITLTATGDPAEPDTPTTLTFTRFSTVGDAVVNFDVAPGATYNIDYTVSGADTYGPSSGTITIPDGATSASLVVTPINDQLGDPDETVALTVRAGVGYSLGSAPGLEESASRTIVDNDTVTVAATGKPAEGGARGTYTFTRGNTDGTLAVLFEVSGNAEHGVDYVLPGSFMTEPARGTVIFAPGSATVSMSLFVLNDGIADLAEVATVTVIPTVRYTAAAPDSAELTIRDNDGLIVSTADDEDDGDFSTGDLSLRELVDYATPGSTITFDPSLASQTITLESQLLIDRNLTIDGAAASGVIVSGGHASRVFLVDSGVVTIENLTISDGFARGGDGGQSSRYTTASGFAQYRYGGGTGGGAGGLGGGILAIDADLTLANVTMANNSAVGGNGGEFVARLMSGGGGGGGLSGANGANGGLGQCSGAGGAGGSGLPAVATPGGLGQNGRQAGFFPGTTPGALGGVAGARFGGGGGGGGAENCSGQQGGNAGFGGFGAGGGGGGRGGSGSDGGAGGYGGGGGGQGSNNLAHFNASNNSQVTLAVGGAFGGNGTKDIDGGHGGGGAGLGGAVFVKAGSLTLDGVSFTGNSAIAGTGGVGNDGQAKAGALFVGPEAVNFSAIGVTYSGNTAANAAGTVDDNADAYGANIAPSISTLSATSVSENTATDVTIEFTDPDFNDVITVVIQWGDGTADTTVVDASSPLVESHTYTQNQAGDAPYIATVTATDQGGETDSDTVAITVTNAAPNVTATNATVVVFEGQTATNGGVYNDAADDVTLTASIGIVTKTGTSDGTWSWTFGTGDGPADSQTVTITATDADGAVATTTFDLTVNNANPTFAVDNATVTVAEGQTVTNTGTYSDVAGDTVSLFASQGTLTKTGTNSGTWTWTFDAIDGPDQRVITISGLDSDGGVGAVQFDLTITNAAPDLTVDNATVAVDEGNAATNSGTYTDSGDDVTLTVSPGTITKTGTNDGTWSWTANTNDGPADSETVTITATDADGAVATATFDLIVNNVAPAVSIRRINVNDVEGATLNFNSLLADVSADAAAGYGFAWSVTKDGAPYGTTGTSRTYSFVPDDNGSYVVTFTGTDKDGGSSTDTRTVVVQNADPAALIVGAPATSPEGTEIALTSTASDPSPVDENAGIARAWEVEKNGDLYASGSGNTFSFTPDDEGQYLVELTGTDKDGGTSLFRSFITVSNVAPTVEVGPAEDLDEGDTFTRIGSFTDPGSTDTHTATVDYGDGAGAQPLPLLDGAFSLAHTYADDGTFLVAVAVTDDGGLTTTGELSVTVSNVAPTVDAGGDQTVDEGALLSLDSAVFSDAGTLDTHTATIDWGDGSPVDVAVVSEAPLGSVGADGSVAGGHVFADDGTYTVTVTVTDDDGATASDTLMVSVSNVVPSVDAGPDAAVAEGELFVGSSSFIDPGAADTHVATVDYGDGSAIETVTPIGDSFGLSHVYADDGTFTVTITVADDDGSAGSDSLDVTVSNVAPSLDAGGDQTVDEGALLSLDSAVFSDAGTLDTHTATIDWGDGSSVDVAVVSEAPFGPPGSSAGADGTVSGGHVFADDGTYTVTVTVTDDDSSAAVDTLTVTVTNAAPAVDAGLDTEVAATQAVSLAAMFNDAGTNDTHTATVDWGDGTPVQSLTVNESPFGPPGNSDGAVGTASGSHVYAAAGAYAVVVTVTDDDGDSSSDTLLITVVGAREATENVVAELAVFEDVSSDVAKALKSIEDALDDALWVDETHVTTKKGAKVFDNLEDAVKGLLDAVDDSDDPDLQAAALAAILNIVDSTRILAVTRLDEANVIVPTIEDEEKVNKKRAESQENLDEGDAFLAAGDYRKAIDAYKDTWKKANDAFKAAGLA